MGTTRAPWGLSTVRQYLPPWLGGNDAYTRSLSGMLRALTTAVGSYLEASSSTVEIVHPIPVSDDYLDTLRSACSSLSLHMPLSAQPPAGILAARAHDVGGKCSLASAEEAPKQDESDDPAQLILTVDYSRAALSAMLVVEECGIFEYRRLLHDASLGTEILSRGSHGNHGNLTQAIRKLINLPLEDGNGAGLTQISALVLLGESAGDQRLGDALKESLGEQFGAMAVDARKRQIDPLFAASNGVASDYLDRLNFEQL